MQPANTETRTDDPKHGVLHRTILGAPKTLAVEGDLNALKCQKLRLDPKRKRPYPLRNACLWARGFGAEAGLPVGSARLKAGLERTPILPASLPPATTERYVDMKHNMNLNPG